MLPGAPAFQGVSLLRRWAQTLLPANFLLFFRRLFVPLVLAVIAVMADRRGWPRASGTGAIPGRKLLLRSAFRDYIGGSIRYAFWSNIRFPVVVQAGGGRLEIGL